MKLQDGQTLVCDVLTLTQVGTPRPASVGPRALVDEPHARVSKNPRKPRSESPPLLSPQDPAGPSPCP